MPQIWKQDDGQWNSIALSEAQAMSALTGDGDQDALLAKAGGEGMGWALLTRPNSRCG
jgi:hypothetical protein